MARLSDIENDDDLAGGVIERRVLEQCKASCDECEKYICEWTDYDTALAKYIDHRELHHKINATVRL